MPRPASPPPPGRVADGDDETDPPSLADLLVEMAEAGRRVRDRAIETPPAMPRAPRIGGTIAGCLFRLLLLLLVLGLLALAAVTFLVNATF
jgi:hypothetical protein